MIAKTAEDIAALREGGKRLARHLRKLSALVKPGVVVNTLEARAREMVSAEGDDLAFFGYKGGKGEKPFPSGLCISINDALVHGAASENDSVIQDGDIVKLDFGIRHKGLFTDSAVTVIAGTKRDKDDERLVRGVFESLALGIAQARVGNTTGDIGHAVEEYANEHKFGFPKNLSGHGVGTAVHEEPHVPNFGFPGTGVKLVENLVIAIEPMFTLGSGQLYIGKDGFAYCTKDGSRSAHAEHTVIITKDGPEILTKE